jgi:DNA-binding beta-propeller fold protein YncE
MRTNALLGLLVMVVVAVVPAQQAPYRRDVPAALLKNAKVSEDSARRIAQAQVPKGVLKALELEQEKGRLVYSLEFTVAGEQGIVEVNVDALSGAIVNVEHESSGTVALKGYHLVATYTLGGDGGWDYVTFDSAGHRLFIARQTRVMVVDATNGKLLGEIPGLQGAHGVAIAGEFGHGFATSGRDSSVLMFDLKTLAVLHRATAAIDADGILYEPVTKRIFTMNGDAASSSVFDPRTGEKIGTVPLGGKPEFGVSAGDGKLYINLEDKGTVVEVDAQAMKVTAEWSLTPCESPTGLAIDRAHHRVFSGCRNKFMAISDVVAGKTLGTVPIGASVDATAYDPGMQLAFASNGDGTLTVAREVAPGRFGVVENVTTQLGARTMALDPATHRIYLVTGKLGPGPAATPDNPRPRPSVVPGTFVVLVFEP